MGDILKNHHAFLFISPAKDYLTTLKTFLEEQYHFDCHQSNPDLWEKNVETFGIEESRELKQKHLQKAVGKDGIKLFLVRADFVTFEAQNALLKILEEPAQNNFFFFVLSSRENILPTLFSRFLFIGQLAIKESKQPEILEFEIEYFLNVNIPTRLKLIASLIEDKGKVLAFLRELETTYYKKVNIKELSSEDNSVFESIFEARKYVSTRGGSLKMILENLSLAIPKV